MLDNLLSSIGTSPMTAVFGLVALVVILIIMRSMKKWNADNSNSFNIIDLLMENQRASKGAMIMMGAFGATTWFFIYYTLAGKMTEGYFGLYSAAWIAPVVVRMLTNQNQPPTPPG